MSADLRPCGYFVESYRKDARFVHTRLERVLMVFALAAIFALPAFLDVAWVSFLNRTAITLVVVMGLQIMTGYTGLINIGQSAFMGVGAYATAIIGTHLDVPFLVVMLLGACATTVFGLLFAFPAGRIHGFYFALTTLAAQFLFAVLIVRLPAGLFGGATGLRLNEPAIFGFAFNTPHRFFYLVAPIALLATIIVINIVRSRVGRAFIAVRDNDHVASVTGINIFWYRVLAFSVAAFFAGIAGSLIGYRNGFVHFEQFTLFQSLWFLAMLIIGGLASPLGAFLGVLSLSLLQELINIFGAELAAILPVGGASVVFPLLNLALGVALILSLILMPRGMAHMYHRAERRYRLWPFPH